MAGSKSTNKAKKQQDLAALMTLRGITRPANNGLSGIPNMRQTGSAANQRRLDTEAAGSHRARR